MCVGREQERELGLRDVRLAPSTHSEHLFFRTALHFPTRVPHQLPIHWFFTPAQTRAMHRIPQDIHSQAQQQYPLFLQKYGGKCTTTYPRIFTLEHSHAAYTRLMCCQNMDYAPTRVQPMTKHHSAAGSCIQIPHNTHPPRHMHTFTTSYTAPRASSSSRSRLSSVKADKKGFALSVFMVLDICST